MEERFHPVLIVDTNPDTLITLQQVLERAKVGTTTIWDEAEARQSLAARSFDLLIVGDHPSELDAAAILYDLGLNGIRSSLILRGTVLEREIEHFRGLGAIDLVPKREPLVVLEQVARGLSPMRFEATPEKAGLAHSGS